jgi:hypothetical protein
MRSAGPLAAAGSTGNNTHASQDVPEEASALALEFEITAVGATPTVSWLFQASNDPPSVSDANSDWFSLMVLPVDSVTETAAVQTKTAVGVYTSFVPLARLGFNKLRLVTSANTNVTYEAEAFSA